MAFVELDIVLFEGETAEEVAQIVAGRANVTWDIYQVESWPTVVYYGAEAEIGRVARRYSKLGYNPKRQKRT